MKAVKRVSVQVLSALVLGLLAISCQEDLKSENNAPTEEIAALTQPIENSNLSADLVSSSVILDNSRRWQMIYSSQNYGTNYAVYAQFVLDSETSTKESVDVRRINFKLINYKQNMVGLGLKSIMLNKDTATNSVHFDIVTKGLISNKETTLVFDQPLQLKNNTLIKAERTLEPLYEISQETAQRDFEDFQVFKRANQNETSYFKAENYFYTDIVNGLPKDSISVFDSEFFYKDGDLHMVKPDFDPIMEEKYNGMMLPGKRCKQSFLVATIAI
ncbi:hypothetical protein [Maribacter sp.]